MSTRAHLGSSVALQSQPEPWPNQNSNPLSNQKTGKLTSRGKVLCLQFAKYPYTNNWGVISDLQLSQPYFLNLSHGKTELGWDAAVCAGLRQNMSRHYTWQGFAEKNDNALQAKWSLRLMGSTRQFGRKRGKTALNNMVIIETEDRQELTARGLMFLMIWLINMARTAEESSQHPLLDWILYTVAMHCGARWTPPASGWCARQPTAVVENVRLASPRQRFIHSASSVCRVQICGTSSEHSLFESYHHWCTNTPVLLLLINTCGLVFF